MAIPLSTIRSQVRSYVDESSPSDWTNAELNTLINQRYHRVYTTIVTVFEDYYLTTTQFNTVASQQEYGTSDSFPSDLYKLRRVEINYDVSGSNSVPLRALPLTSLELIRRDIAQTNVGVKIFTTPYYYLLGVNKIGFIPIPDKAGTNAVKVWYVKTLADLSSDSSNIDIPYPERYWHIIAEGATADALRFGQQESIDADKFDAKFDRGLVLMQQELEDKIADETKYVVDVTDMVLDFSTY